MIGGLLQESQLSNVSRTPGISSIPVIGGLFRVRRETSQRTDLYIVITPHVLVR